MVVSVWYKKLLSSRKLESKVSQEGATLPTSTSSTCPGNLVFSPWLPPLKGSFTFQSYHKLATQPPAQEPWGRLRSRQPQRKAKKAFRIWSLRRRRTFRAWLRASMLSVLCGLLVQVCRCPWAPGGGTLQLAGLSTSHPALVCCWWQVLTQSRDPLSKKKKPPFPASLPGK